MKRYFLGVMFVLLWGCASIPNEVPLSYPTLEGDPQRGEMVFATSVNQAPACSSCHRTDAVNLVGPSLAGFADRAGTRLNGRSAEVYTFESIVAPSHYIVSGFTNVMYPRYATQLSEQEIADLIAYLMTLGA